MATDFANLTKEQLQERITISECRLLREVITTLTSAPVLTRDEYLSIMYITHKSLERLEKEMDTDRLTS